MPSYRTKNKTNDRNACKVFRFGLIGKSLTPSVDERQKMKSHEFDKESSPETHVEFLLVTNLIINICTIVENKRNDSFILIIYGSHVGERLTSVCFLCALTLHGYICFFIPQKNRNPMNTHQRRYQIWYESHASVRLYIKLIEEILNVLPNQLHNDQQPKRCWK